MLIALMLVVRSVAFRFVVFLSVVCALWFVAFRFVFFRSVVCALWSLLCGLWLFALWSVAFRFVFFRSVRLRSVVFARGLLEQ